MKTIFPFAFIALLFFIQCKKETPIVVSHECPNIDAKTYNGIFTNDVYSDNFGPDSVMRSSQTFLARFWKMPQEYASCNELSSSRVFINNSKLNYFGSGCSSGYVFSRTQPNFSNEDDWQIYGDSVRTFLYANKDPLPVCTDLEKIPTTISKASGLTFTIHVSNVSTALLQLGDSLYSPYSVSENYTLNEGINVISLSPAKMAAWGEGNEGYVGLILTKISIVNACTRNYMFTKSAHINKRLVVKP